MADRHHDWLTAAACHEGPRPVATFADLPHDYQNDIVRFGLLAVASTAFFIAVGILITRLPSRSLASPASLPHPVPTRAPILEARLSVLPEPVAARPVGARTVRRRATDDSGLQQSVSAVRASVAQPAPARRGNFVSRFFKGMRRLGGLPSTAKADTTQ